MKEGEGIVATKEKLENKTYLCKNTKSERMVHFRPASKFVKDVKRNCIDVYQALPDGTEKMTGTLHDISVWKIEQKNPEDIKKCPHCGGAIGI